VKGKRGRDVHGGVELPKAVQENMAVNRLKADSVMRTGPLGMYSIELWVGSLVFMRTRLNDCQ